MSQYKVILQCTQVREYVYLVDADTRYQAEDAAKHRYLVGYDAHDSSGVLSDEVTDINSREVTTW